MPFADEKSAIDFIFRTRRKLDEGARGADDRTRDVSFTQRLLAALGLPSRPREYAVITGSRGKGSTAAITAKILQHLGHTVGLVTGPHLISWMERIRINGRAIPQSDFLRILDDLAPEIERIESLLGDLQYLSPQGIFLAIALRWFDEQAVSAAVLEVGRGGRFDDIAVVPNQLSLFTHIELEHVNYLGPTLDRIAWHKAGIIKPRTYAYSVPQEKVVLDIIQAEAEAKDAEFYWLSSLDMAEYLRQDDSGLYLRLGRYGELYLSLLGRYQIENATLAVQGAGNMHGRLDGIPHGSAQYVARVRDALADVRWPGRCEKINDRPAVYLDAAISPQSARLFVESVRRYITRPTVVISGVPVDRDYAGVYRVFAEVCDTLIITETDINPHTRFPSSDVALAAARAHHPDARYARRLPEALELAHHIVGTDGTILIGASQMLIGEAQLIWGRDLSVI